MDRGRKHILDETMSYFPNTKPPFWSTGGLRVLHVAEWYPLTSSPSPDYKVKRSRTWGECPEILQDGKWVKTASKVSLPLERQSMHTFSYCLQENRRTTITILVLILSASCWFQQQSLLHCTHSSWVFFLFFFLKPVSKISWWQSPSFRPSDTKAMMQLLCAPSQDHGAARLQDVGLPFSCSWHVALGTWPAPAQWSLSPCLSSCSQVKQLRWWYLESYPAAPSDSLLNYSVQVW